MKPVFKTFKMRPYEHPSCIAPIWIVTPDDGFYIHTFFDVDPISPSGRYLACLKLPCQDRVPGHEDLATVCIVDLKASAIAEICETSAWGTQVGAHLTWGGCDDELFFNLKDGARVYAARYNLTTGDTACFDGPVYQASRDGRYLYGPNLGLINYAQEGYGATVDPALDYLPSINLDTPEGTWRTDTRSGEKKLILSIRQAYDLLADKTEFTNGRFVFFHTKINRQGTRIFQVVRYLMERSVLRNGFIVSCGIDGECPRIALPYEMWLKGSHHPDWHPDGKHILMNLRMNQMRFCLFEDNFNSLRFVAPQRIGGGHPSYRPDGRLIATDAYTHESFIDEKKLVPIRLIEPETGSECELCRIWTLGGSDIGSAFRCDPHPAWNSDGTKLTFNAAPEGKKLIMIADMSALQI